MRMVRPAFHTSAVIALELRAVKMRSMIERCASASSARDYITTSR
jgi:hypothetical protein